MRLFEFEAPIKEEELDEAAPENARSLAIYNELADQFADNPKALKQEFMRRRALATCAGVRLWKRVKWPATES